MEPSDSDYEHCGGCGCLSECGCACSDCRGAVRTMVEVGHGGGCDCTKPEETMAGKVRALELQIDELKKALYAECTGQACNPDDCYQGYRQCTGCEIRAKKAYGEGWGK